MASDFNKFKINNYYNNNSFNDSTGLDLWRTLKESYSFKWDSVKTKNCSVKLELIDNNKLNVSLIFGNEIVDNFHLTGKTKGNYFSIDKNLSYIPFFPIYYMHKESKTIIGNDDEGNLIVINGLIREGHILVMGAGHRRIKSEKFNRIKN